VDEPLRSEWASAREANRTASAYEPWREELLTQVAVAWVLACVFVRFCEDNDLVEAPWLSGPGLRRQRALDQRQHYFQQHPTETDREYLYDVFEQMARLPGLGDLFDKRHNPLWRVGLSGDGATKLLAFWQRIDPATGQLAHDFSDPEWDTRFLGDLYQDLSEAARKKYALLQTPEFVEEFILDRTLEPALDEFGLDAAPVYDREGKPITSPGFRMIDPACGSGHFLLGSFRRILNLWQKKEPGAKVGD